MSEAKLMEFEVEEGTKVPAAEGHLGLFSSINMIAGVVIGSGIFASASGAVCISPNFSKRGLALGI